MWWRQHRTMLPIMIMATMMIQCTHTFTQPFIHTVELTKGTVNNNENVLKWYFSKWNSQKHNRGDIILESFPWCQRHPDSERVGQRGSSRLQFIASTLTPLKQGKLALIKNSNKIFKIRQENGQSKIDWRLSDRSLRAHWSQPAVSSASQEPATTTFASLHIIAYRLFISMTECALRQRAWPVCCSLYHPSSHGVYFTGRATHGTQRLFFQLHLISCSLCDGRFIWSTAGRRNDVSLDSRNPDAWTRESGDLMSTL